MFQLVLIIHILVAIAVISLVLIQHGKGADMGAGFGQGASGTVLGSEGSLPFLFKLTAALAAIFFVTSLSLAYMTARQSKTAPVLHIQQQAAHVVTPQSSLPVNQTETKDLKN